jgi:hypothetical protein
VPELRLVVVLFSVLSLVFASIQALVLCAILKDRTNFLPCQRMRMRVSDCVSFLDYLRRLLPYCARRLLLAWMPPELRPAEHLWPVLGL